ncbi:hypothetical protein SDC9_156885 [bioreactor metagenome]|uniref:Uncharacterized protein n=1 Tax=bioreactor metagenome TaxID=1076179 RepID=A0A645FAL1_9ZZZZ
MAVDTAIVIDATEPTDKSNPPTTREIITPVAITVVIDIALSIFTRLAACMNLPSVAIVKNAKITTIVRSVP